MRPIPYTFTLTAGTQLAEGRLVKLDSSGNAVYLTASDDIAATPAAVTIATAASGNPVAVGPVRGTLAAIVASSSITAGSTVYSDADGKVKSTGTNAVGTAVTDASADEFVVVLTI
jgi:hypothetical protein